MPQPVNTDSSRENIAGVVLWALIAALVACLNFLVDLGRTPREVDLHRAISASMLYASIPFLVAVGFAWLRKPRSAKSFFRIAAVLSMLSIVYIGFSAARPPEFEVPWTGWAEQPLEAPPLPADTVEPVELPSD
ncbi:MAG: hypothetical protein AB7E72_05700 [Lysobacterales bacterium]